MFWPHVANSNSHWLKTHFGSLYSSLFSIIKFKVCIQHTFGLISMLFYGHINGLLIQLKNVDIGCFISSIFCWSENKTQHAVTKSIKKHLPRVYSPPTGYNTNWHRSASRKINTLTLCRNFEYSLIESCHAHHVESSANRIVIFIRYTL